MPQYSNWAVIGLSWPWRKAEAEEIRNEKLKVRGKQRSQTSKFQKTAVESVQQQQRGAFADHGHGERIIDPHRRKRPPLHVLRQDSGLWIQQTWAKLFKQ